MVLVQNMHMHNYSIIYDISSINMDIEDFEVTQEITTDAMTDMSMDTAVTDQSVDSFLAEVDAEIGIETGVTLPSTTGESKIKDLEDELNRLKSNE